MPKTGIWFEIGGVKMFVKGLVLGLIIGAIIGGCVTLVLYACIIAGKEADECIEKMRKTHE